MLPREEIVDVGSEGSGYWNSRLSGFEGMVGRLRAFGRTSVAWQILTIIHDATVDERITQSQILAALPTIPSTTVRDVLAALCSAKLVISYRGTGGGYLLTLPPHCISALAVAVAVEMGSPMSRGRETSPLEKTLLTLLSQITLDSYVNTSGNPDPFIE